MIKYNFNKTYFIRNPIPDLRGLSLLLLVMILMVTGCKKELEEFLLGDLKKENPYNGSETLVYLSTNGDTIIFLPDGRYSDFFKSYPNPNSYYWLNEKNRCSFTEENKTHKLEINMTSRYNRGYDMDIVFTNHLYPDPGYCSSWATWYLPLVREGGNLHDFYIDSLKISDRYYYNVYADTTYTFNYKTDIVACNNKNSPKAVFYNVGYGVLKIDFEDGSSWELKEIIP